MPQTMSRALCMNRFEQEGLHLTAVLLRRSGMPPKLVKKLVVQQERRILDRRINRLVELDSYK